MASQNRTHVTSNTPPDAHLLPIQMRREDFGRRLDAWRVKRGWTQADLARHSGIHRASISEYVNGRAFPTSVNLKRLADALGCEPEDLLPNAMINAVEADASPFSITQSAGKDGLVLLRVTQMVTPRQAMQITSILLANDENSDAK